MDQMLPKCEYDIRHEHTWQQDLQSALAVPLIPTAQKSTVCTGCPFIPTAQKSTVCPFIPIAQKSSVCTGCLFIPIAQKSRSPEVPTAKLFPTPVLLTFIHFDASVLCLSPFGHLSLTCMKIMDAYKKRTHNETSLLHIWIAAGGVCVLMLCGEQTFSHLLSNRIISQRYNQFGYSLSCH